MPPKRPPRKDERTPEEKIEALRRMAAQQAKNQNAGQVAKIQRRIGQQIRHLHTGLRATAAQEVRVTEHKETLRALGEGLGQAVAVARDHVGLPLASAVGHLIRNAPTALAQGATRVTTAVSAELQRLRESARMAAERDEISRRFHEEHLAGLRTLEAGVRPRSFAERGPGSLVQGLLRRKADAEEEERRRLAVYEAYRKQERVRELLNYQYAEMRRNAHSAREEAITYLEIQKARDEANRQAEAFVIAERRRDILRGQAQAANLQHAAGAAAADAVQGHIQPGMGSYGGADGLEGLAAGAGADSGSGVVEGAPEEREDEINDLHITEFHPEPAAAAHAAAYYPPGAAAHAAPAVPPSSGPAPPSSARLIPADSSASAAPGAGLGMRPEGEGEEGEEEEDSSYADLEQQPGESREAYIARLHELQIEEARRSGGGGGGGGGDGGGGGRGWW